MTDLVISFTIGIFMALGFGFAGIVRPEVIVGFLNFSGDWQPAVMLVMGSAVIVTFITYRLILRRQRPLLEPKFAIPTRRDIDTKLVLGAILFGAGWGLTGYCPGPALASVFNGAIGVYVFLASMVAGMLLFKVWDRARQATGSTAKSYQFGHATTGRQ